ncbi:type II secretion system protein N [Shewanella sp. AS1]|uniref:type II secretion system protein N n=1 Tax=Shewanella sp. AS1 TaxID=2907626 RepID=UPI001F313A82|nr:type II secretion system protein N [Shewanella sp. AS1]MCE9680134.1 type II secretion system protein N [Shewanella sp. AS1]
MSLVKKIAIGFVVYLVFLVALFPASVAVSLAPLPNMVKISGVSGSVWSGSAEQVLIGQRQLELVSWELNPWGLLLGKADLDLTVGNRAHAVNGKGLVSLSTSGVDIEQLRFDAPSEFLLGNSRLPFRTQVEGNFSLIVQQLTQGTSWCEQLSGKMFAQQLQVNNQFGKYPLGDVELGLSCVDGNIKIATDETMNALGVSGSALLKDKSQFQVSAKIRETDAQPKDLKQALSFLGKKDSQGYYPISYQGRIPGM